MESEIRKVIEQADVEFEKCFKMLCAFKTEDPKEITILLGEFQSTLARAIFNVEKARITVIKREKEIIKNKKNVVESEFLDEIRKSAKYKEALQRTVYVGKSLGDAFAFLFYMNDRKLLNRHLAKPENTMPTSIGGRGEIEFITAAHMVGTQFVLYHGITNMLRIGDYSLFDAKDWTISGLAELKTHNKEKGYLNMTFSALGKKEKLDIELVKDKPKNDALKRHELDDFIQQKLKKQMDAIGNAFEGNGEKLIGDRKINSKYLLAALEECMANSANPPYNYVKADDGLVMLRMPLKGSNMYERYFAEQRLDSEKIDPLLTSLVKSIMNYNGYDNHIEMSTIQYTPEGKPRLQFGVIPLFWHDIAPAFLKQIYFQEVSVLTIFNPSHLLLKLSEQGFVCYSAISDKKMRIGKFICDKEAVAVIENFGFFKNLVKTFLQSEESIAQIFKALPISEEFDCNIPLRFNIESLQHVSNFDPFEKFPKT